MYLEAIIHEWEHYATPHHQKPIEDDKPLGKILKSVISTGPKNLTLPQIKGETKGKTICMKKFQ